MGTDSQQGGEVLTAGPSVALEEPAVSERYRSTLRHALAPDLPDAPEALVWADAGAELLLRPGEAGVALEDGLVLVTLPVATAQTGETTVVVPFAVGRPGVEAGLVMATQTRPRGPDAIVDRWAEPLVAAA